MTLRAHITHIREWWTRLHPSRALERIPDYRKAAEAERRAHRRGCTREIGAARRAKQTALHRAMAGEVR